ncbi:thioredoxin reductase [Actinocorallia herbida]|uniref:Thioredoxin reductase n=1 Tax=Actinocorallia herbida TaxID=58109 RepID=A0A3N1CZ94_9ACTN|nr:FAD-dependent oxidoreductase [Actinocorallia herbida]ROO86613.1 thioredoxin reductase [Actinocorallia herbida]
MGERGLRDDYDVVVVGGGEAGLSGALTLARARRSVLVYDVGGGRDATMVVEVRRHGGRVVQGEVAAVGRRLGRFSVLLADGRRVSARRVLVATGAEDELPSIDGLAARWGRDAVDCPYRHGWAVRDTAIGVLGEGPEGVGRALLWRQWSADVALFTGTGKPSAEDTERLAARGITLVDGRVTAIEAADRVTGVRLDDGTVIPRDVVAVDPRKAARAGFLAAVGLRPVEHPDGHGTFLPSGLAGHTRAPGVWAAGDVTDPASPLAAARAQGALAATAINADLVAEETAEAVLFAQGPFSAAVEARICANRADRHHGL